MRMLIDQPGRSGDILICLPIAKWYSKWFEIDWVCPEEYHPLFEYVDYCKPVVEVDKSKYRKVLDLSFGISTGTSLHQWWLDSRSTWQSFVVAKYFLSDVPLRERWNLSWFEKETKRESLYDLVVDRAGLSYSVVHERTHDCSISISTKYPKVLFEPVPGYTVFDWLLVLSLAQDIHCIDSLLCNFVEVMPMLMPVPKYYYITPKVPNVWDRTLLINNWRTVC